MRETDREATRQKPATSDAIPRAVEFLILTLLRWAFFCLAGVFGLLAVTAWLRHWPWWVAVALSVFLLATAVCGVAIRPRGKFRFDRVGPSVIVPTPGSNSRGDRAVTSESS